MGDSSLDRRTFLFQYIIEWDLRNLRVATGACKFIHVNKKSTSTANVSGSV